MQKTCESGKKLKKVCMFCEVHCHKPKVFFFFLNSFVPMLLEHEDSLFCFGIPTKERNCLMVELDLSETIAFSHCLIHCSVFCFVHPKNNKSFNLVSQPLSLNPI